VRCAIFEFGMWGPYFFEEDDVTVTVTSDRYCAMLESFILSKLDDIFVIRLEFSEKCFLGMLSPCVAAVFARFDSMRFFSLGLRQSPGKPTLSPNFGRS
jgi:hypothetical protein